MEFSSKFKTYKIEKYNLPKLIKNHKNIFFGSGGSNNIILLHQNIVIKIIPEFKKPHNFKKKPNNDQTEVKFFKFFTDNFIFTDITPHIVGYYDHYKLLNISKIFPNKCLSVDKYLLTDPKKIDKVTNSLCRLKKVYDFKLLSSSADILILENCNTNIEKEINTILHSSDKYPKLFDFLDRSIFQFLFTMAQIQQKYPRFIHNDLFLRNILGVNEIRYSDNAYVEYIFDNKSYYFPANGFYLKINDFGYSLNPPYIVSTLIKDVTHDPIGNMEMDDPKRDIYTFFYDYYDGANLGHPSVMYMLKKKSNDVKRKVRRYFNKFIDVKLIDRINKLRRNEIRWMWNIKYSKLLQNCILLARQYFQKGIFDKYSKKDDNYIIVKTFGKK